MIWHAPVLSLLRESGLFREARMEGAKVRATLDDNRFLDIHFDPESRSYSYALSTCRSRMQEIRDCSAGMTFHTSATRCWRDCPTIRIIFSGAALIRRSRGQDVIDEFMAEYQAEVWLSDCWKPQLNAPSDRHQLCLPHQVRALQGLLDKRPHLAWAREMQTLFRTAMHLGKRRELLTARGYRRQVTLLERRLDRLLARRVSGVGANLLDRYRTHRTHLLVFLHRADVPSDNNACERALRPSVIHRKVMGSFRSDWGAQAYAALATVLNTAKRAGENAFQKLINLMGAPVLHFLQPSIA